MFERCRDVGHVAVQAALRKQCAGGCGDQDEAEGQASENEPDERGDAADHGDQDENSNDALGALCCRGILGTVEPMLQRIDEPSDPGHGVSDGAENPVRIAKHDLDQQCQKSE